MKQYVELIEKDIKKRGNIVPISEVNINDCNYERYISHYRFSQEFPLFVKDTKSVADFQGPVCVDNIWVDFDKEDDIAGARAEAIKFLQNLSKISGLPYKTFPVFFSGNKGFHIGINSKLLDIQNQFSKNLPDDIKRFIKKITKDIQCVDYSIYNKNRVIRLPFSKNKKSGLYKIYLPFDVFWKEDVDTIKDYAKSCKHFKMDTTPVAPNVNLMSLYNSKDNQDISERLPTTNRSLFSIPQNGERNNTLFKQACRLYSMSELTTGEVRDMMANILKLTKGNGFSNQEFENLLASAYKTVRVKDSNSINIRPVDTLTRSVIDDIMNHRYIPTGVAEWDEDLDGGLVRGNTYSIIGKGGTKKSLFAMSIGLMNCMTKGTPIAYFNMEMSTSQSFIRAFKMLFNIDIKDKVKSGDITDLDIDKMGKDFNDVLKNKFYLIDNNNLTPKDVSGVLDEIKSKYDQKVGLVVLDSMNSMATIGNSEAFTAFEISKEIKQIAKDQDVVVMLINHITKGVPGHVRDVSLYVRGGEKIRDNCDAYFCLSQCVDKENSTLVGEDKDYVYIKEIIYSRFVNKRESGNTIDKILELGADINPRPLDINPKSYELNYTGK